MILAIDIGNTTTALGFFDGKALSAEFELSTRDGRTSDEIRAVLLSLFQRRFGDVPVVSRVVMCCVVPGAVSVWTEAIGEFFKTEPLIVGPGVRTGMTLRVQEPQSLGADRVTVALAARELFTPPCVVVDFGTALSFDVIGADGGYEGGVIAPGPAISVEALVAHAAKLPSVEFVRPRTVIGKTTSGAMQSGAVLGFGCMIDGIIEAIESEIGPVAHVIATGRGASQFAQHSKRITAVEPALCLHGLRLVSEINVPKRANAS
jgi:type III pantothenate kinase